jgi:DNA polymerase-3 subunit gamma/tau
VIQLPYALRYRPQRFSDLVCGKSTVRILQNSIKEGRILNAYFFSGSRGLGKTSIARIFAKAINCLNLKPDVAEPCNECTNCREITEAKSLDVIEIDSASENSVNAIRELTRRVEYAPTSSRKKVVILDEVHMLSTAAANALLKTLEEPPRHVVFLFCTTDPERVITTIKSRCLCFTFSRLSVDDIVGRLKYIADQEAIQISEPALRRLALAVNGGMRDAVNLLDQARLVSPDSTITPEIIGEVLGTVPFTKMADLFVEVLRKDIPAINKWFDDIFRECSEQAVVASLIDFLSTCFLIKNGVSSFSDITAEMQQRIKTVFSDIDSSRVMDMMEDVKRLNSDMRSLTFINSDRLVRITLYKHALGLGGHRAPSMQSQFSLEPKQVQFDPAQYLKSQHGAKTV